MALPADFAQHVKSAADIVRVIGETVTLKKSGSNHIGLCPFHQEKTPSFSVHATRQFYYCFGCGAKGDVFRFVMEMEKVPFPEAVRRVAQRAGIPVPAYATADEAATPEARLRKALEEVHERALAFYRKQLQSAEAAPVRELIRQRGVTDESVQGFGLGYAPTSGDALANFLSREGLAANVLEASGLVLRRDTGGYFDRFRGRWMFPITNETGKTIAFAGRALGSDQPKYLNSPETPLYTKSRVLYNLSRAREAIRKAGAALLVEGYMDAIAAWQAGIENVIASCGTSLTEPQVHLLTRCAPEVIVSYDPDSAGVAATDRSLGLLLEGGMSVRILRLPGALDPDQYVRQFGAEAYKARLTEAQPVFRYLATRALELHGTASPEAKLAAVNFVLPFVARVPNKLIRAELAADIAQKIDVSTGLVWEAFRKAALDRREQMQAPATGSRIPNAEAMLIRLLLDSEEACKDIGNRLENKGLLEELEGRTIVSALLGMIAGGSIPDVASLADRLDESQQRLLAAVVFDNEARPVSFGEINTYILALDRKRVQRQRLSLQHKIQAAQKSQDSQLAIELLREQNELDKELAKLL
ncbi:MAG: DNA primase [Acidobacteria bacterium RIFCSPLOWO2_02_FULL_61_28]|nr:MAG: DNA primase [Acidobacteria bacterium RIFCSPLOWO2_02_FULL_61_28]